MMDSLFPPEPALQQNDTATSAFAPLAERIRPRILTDVVGQEHLLAAGMPLHVLLSGQNTPQLTASLPSMILWGPPGTGKTTLALLIAQALNAHVVRMSAVEAGVKEVREVIAAAQKRRNVVSQTQPKATSGATILFIDEIHRFSKSQQDALLHAVESGVITLIGATTENPSFEVNAALLSRCQIYRLQSLSESHIRTLVERALRLLSEEYSRTIRITDWDVFMRLVGGDARTALNAVELSLRLALSVIGHEESNTSDILLTRDFLETALQQKTPLYDKAGENHYDTISAFIKSLRGSDPDAALLWMAVMLEAGEDARFVARRMVVFASEDIGNADPQALQTALAVFRAVEVIGMPEARINLAQGVTYLASAPKSNASYVAVEAALADVRGGVITSVPLHLRNAPTKYMKSEGYGREYKYPHDFEGGYVEQQYFPDSVQPRTYYMPREAGKEGEFRERLHAYRPERYSLPPNSQNQR